MSLTGIFSSPMVLSSVKVMLKDPSPSMEMHILLGLASLAPIMYPVETPMVPREPDESICRGCVHVMSCAVTIWWMPTPVEKMASSILPDSTSCRFISEIAPCAHIFDRETSFASPFSSCTVNFSAGYRVILMGFSASNLCFLSIHSFVLLVSAGGSARICALTARRNFFPVVWTKKSGLTCLAFSEKRTSTWMTPPRPSWAACRAAGMKSLGRPVMRSSNRDPMQISRSQSWIR
mmetsp:Transcript_36868/g.66304  ORF Transcript_36868/g.66304 Transcript_36868/m.66304 type:complete len:235 (+) Transcript_36868:473-1177(+)